MENNLDGLKNCVQEWSKTHPSRPLGTMRMKLSDSPVLFAVIKRGSRSFFDYLLEDCLNQNYPVDTIQYNSINMLHAVIESVVPITPVLTRMLESGFPIEALDPTEHPPCEAAMKAIKRGLLDEFKLCLCFYTQEQWAISRPILEGALETFLCTERQYDDFRKAILEYEAREITYGILRGDEGRNKTNKVRL